MKIKGMNGILTVFLEAAKSDFPLINFQSQVPVLLSSVPVRELYFIM